MAHLSLMQESAMGKSEEAIKSATFGRRKIRPRVCVADGKQHIRKFLGEALEELGFITCECAQAGELSALLDAQLPDLVVVALSAGGIEVAAMLKVLAARAFDGKVLLLGPRNSPVVAAVQELGEQLGIAMLPTLATPFGVEGLRNSVATLRPVEAPRSPPVDVAEALSAGWLELWYQPTRTRSYCAAPRRSYASVIRPGGVVPPAYFMPDEGDPHLRVLSDFVIGRAIDDWRHFITQHWGLEIAINLPTTCFQDPESIASLCRQMPDHPAFEGLIIEIDATDVIRNLDLVKAVARQLRFSNIAISIDDLGSDVAGWAARLSLRRNQGRPTLHRWLR
jgi:CheY-like chemotaxis protein